MPTYSIVNDKKNHIHLVYVSTSDFMQYSGTKKECESYIKHRKEDFVDGFIEKGCEKEADNFFAEMMAETM